MPVDHPRMTNIVQSAPFRNEVYVVLRRLHHSSTAILSEKYRISSELRSQATAGPVSTTVGDHVGIRGAVGSLLFLFLFFVAFFVACLGSAFRAHVGIRGAVGSLFFLACSGSAFLWLRGSRTA